MGGGTSAGPVTSAVTDIAQRLHPFPLPHAFSQGTLKLKKIANFNKLNLLNSISV